MPTAPSRVSVFLLPHDIPGPRILTAGTPADPAAYPGVTADYLVTEGTGQPPGGTGRSRRGHLPAVDRRRQCLTSMVTSTVDAGWGSLAVQSGTWSE